ncbi:hypothetical protein PIB30_115273, partial [Stylosanthes scabra]|nr:hypothetical protein [Stylosanthes scabra]
MLEGLGFRTHRALHWYDCTEEDLEAGLYRIHGDVEVFDMRANVVRNFGLSEQFDIFVEHEVNVPLLATAPGDTDAEPIVVDEGEGLSSSSTDDGGYESAEDEPYKPPPAGVDDDTE